MFLYDISHATEENLDAYTRLIREAGFTFTRLHDIDGGGSVFTSDRLRSDIFIFTNAHDGTMMAIGITTQ